MENIIPISDEQKVFLANGIFRAVTQDMPEVIAEYNLPTSVGAGLFRWNFINRNLSDYLGGDFESFIQPRGAWPLLLLRDKVSNLSFSIMSEKNFRKLQRSLTDSVHYLEALISQNKCRESEFHQLSLFSGDRCRDENVLFALRNQLLSCFSGIVEEHVLILFDYNFSGVTSARAALLNPNMEIALSEDWTQFLRATYSPKNIVFDDLDDNDDLATLKPQYTSEATAVVKQEEKVENE